MEETETSEAEVKPKRRGGNRRPVEKIRTVGVRLTSEEFTALEANAKVNFITLSAYIRQLVFTGKVTPRRIAGLKEKNAQVLLC